MVSADDIFEPVVPDPSVDNDSQLMSGVMGFMSNSDFRVTESITDESCQMTVGYCWAMF